MGTANTAWKLTDLWNVALFTFDSANGWQPTNENQAAELTGEIYNLPWDNLVQKFDFGLGRRSITLQGTEVSDKDVWALSSAVAKRQLMKLWVGEDWFYYVLGTEPRQIRDQSLPYQKSYFASFMAVDPHYYFADSANGGTDATKNQVGPTTAVGSAWSTKQTNISINLTGSGANEGTTDGEPIFWIVGGASTSISSVACRDDYGRQLTYSPTTSITNGHVHVIMPWRNTVEEGFVVNDATGFRLVDGTANAYITEPAGTMGGSVSARGTWAMDAFNHGAGTDINGNANVNTYGFISEEVPCKVEQTTSYGIFVNRARLYPQLKDGKGNILRVVATGTETDTKVFVQYCPRRI